MKVRKGKVSMVENLKRRLMHDSASRCDPGRPFGSLASDECLPSITHNETIFFTVSSSVRWWWWWWCEEAPDEWLLFIVTHMFTLRNY